MTEQQAENVTTFEGNKKFEQEELANQFFQALLLNADRLTKLRFKTVDEAAVACTEFVDQYMELADRIPRLGQIVVTVLGSGVRIPNIHSDFNEDGKVTMDFNVDNPLIDIDPLQEKQGTLTDIIADPIPFIEEGEVRYMPEITAVFVDSSSITSAINNQFGFPLSILNISNKIVVACSAEVAIRLPVLDTYHSLNKTLAEIALTNPGSPRLMSDLHNLGRAIHGEASSFMPLRNTRMLKGIARYARDGRIDHELVASAVRDVFGKNRPLVISGALYTEIDGVETEDSEVRGRIVDVLPTDPRSAEKVPTIVLSDNAYIEHESLYFAPLDKIDSLQF